MSRFFKRVTTTFLGLVLAIFMVLNTTLYSLKVEATDLMEGIESNNVEGKTVDGRFVEFTSNFSIEMFKRSFDDENTLVSPLSIMLALCMTANGADEGTLAQIEKVLGDGTKIGELNRYLLSYAKSLPNEPKSKFKISNSIWFKEGFHVERDFLQTNADYYNANCYRSPFDEQTLKDINNWVKHKTDGMIDSILDRISEDAVMYLINAIVFDAEWETVYKESDIIKDDFTNLDGRKTRVDFMHSFEARFLKDDSATGFVKSYKNGGYSFVALLPNEDVSIAEYINGLTGEYFINTLENVKNQSVSAYIPKFSYEYEVGLNDILKDMGMPDAFDESKADFSRMNPDVRLVIADVLHKTFINVDEKGTKAGAVTKVEMAPTSMPQGETVMLDRPFVYAIVDNSTNLPLFIGAVTNLD